MENRIEKGYMVISEKLELDALDSSWTLVDANGVPKVSVIGDDYFQRMNFDCFHRLTSPSGSSSWTYVGQVDDFCVYHFVALDCLHHQKSSSWAA